MIPLQGYKDKHVAVFGLGKSGKATYAALHAAGARVIAWDDHYDQEDIDLIHYHQWDMSALDAIILSPGIPLHFPKPHAVVQAARKHNVRITCDITLLMEACPDATYIGITGTNGKSTTTALAHHCLGTLGATVQCGGNIGTPVLAMQPLYKGEYYVLELSSYQLDLMDAGAIDIACLLNITPDHIDRHGDMAGYIAAKERIFARQNDNDTAIIAIDDEVCSSLAQTYQATTISAKSRAATYYMDQGHIYDAVNKDASYPLNVPTLQGVHNHQNALMVYAICAAAGYQASSVVDAMASFPGLAHRMERVAVIQDTLYVNDSKATNADAAAQSLATYDHIHWIVGGVAKDGGIASLAPYFHKVIHAYCIGQSAEYFAQQLKDTPYSLSYTLEEALAQAHQAVAQEPNAVILFAPAAASFDQFANFEVRGDCFKEYVKKLK